MHGVVQQIGDRRGDLCHGGNVRVTEALAAATDHGEDGHDFSVEIDRHDQSRAVAEESQRPPVGRTCDAVVEVGHYLLGQPPQSQWLAAPVDHDAGRWTREGVRVPADEAFGQTIEDGVAMSGRHPNQLLSRRNDDSAPVGHIGDDRPAQPFEEFGTRGGAVQPGRDVGHEREPGLGPPGFVEGHGLGEFRVSPLADVGEVHVQPLAVRPCVHLEPAVERSEELLEDHWLT